MTMSGGGPDSPKKASCFGKCYTVGIVVCAFSISVALLNVTKYIYVQYIFLYMFFHQYKIFFLTIILYGSQQRDCQYRRIHI